MNSVAFLVSAIAAFIIFLILTVIIIKILISEGHNIMSDVKSKGISAATSGALKAVKLKIKLRLLGLADLICLIIGVICLIIYVITSITDNILNTASLLFYNSGECTCALKCYSEGSVDNSLTTYSLLYGNQAYSDFLANTLKVDTYEMEAFGGDTGAEKSQYILANYNHDLMTEDDIKALQDQKINGRNQNCPVCSTAGEEEAYLKCQGAMPKTKDWNWEKVYVDYLTPDGEGGTTPTQGGGSVTGEDGSEWVQGHAYGDMTAELDDGTYFWYHQTSGCSCASCGNWSSSTWGAGSKQGAFSADGCAVYSLAMAISNLIGKPVTPAMILTNLGCTSSMNGTVVKWDTSTSEAFTGRGIIRDKALSILSSIYGFSYKSVKDDWQEWDAILDKGGYVWTQFDDRSTKWTKYKNSRHFMVIRKKSGNDSDDLYYCFTSTSGQVGGSGKEASIATMNLGLKKTDVTAGTSPEGKNKGFGLWIEGDVYLGGSSYELIPTGKLYTPITNGNNPDTTPDVKLGLTNSNTGLYLYAGLPWATDSNTFFVDTDVSVTALYNYINTVSDEKLTKGRSLADTLKTSRVNYEYGFTYKSSTSGMGTVHTGYTKGDGVHYKTVDGVVSYPVALPPALLNRDYNVSYGDDELWSVQPWKLNQAGRGYNYKTSKVVAVFEGKSGQYTGKTYYLPMTLDDSKGHTFPGGLAQTNVQADKTGSYTENGKLVFRINIATTNGDVGGSANTVEKSKIAHLFNTTKSAGYYPMDYVYSAVELNGIDKQVLNKLNSNFKLKGVIVYGDSIYQ